MEEKFRQFINKLLPDTWQLILWYNINDHKPKENTAVFCSKGGIELSHHYAAVYRNGEFTDMCTGNKLKPVWWRNI